MLVTAREAMALIERIERRHERERALRTMLRIARARRFVRNRKTEEN